MAYIDDLTNLICGQVDQFIGSALRPEEVEFSGRSENISEKGPKYSGSDQPIGQNADPEYQPNMIELMNTPFDHIDRIML